MPNITGTRSAFGSRKQPGSGTLVLDDFTEHPANVFFVDSNGGGGDTAGFGLDPDNAFLTWDFAIGQCTANQGDVIYIMPGHAETIATAAAVNMDVAGVTVIGLGHGAARPTFTLSATGSTIALAAASCVIRNLLITSSAAATIMLDVNAADCLIEDCDFLMETAVTAIDVDGGSANTCDRTVINRCLFDASTDGPDEAVHLNEVADNVRITNCYAFGLFDDACIHNPSGSVLTNLLIADNVVLNTTAASHSIELVSACTGMIARNMSASPLDDVTPLGIDNGACTLLQNFGSDNTDATSGVLTPVALT